MRVLAVVALLAALAALVEGRPDYASGGGYSYPQATAAAVPLVSKHVYVHVAPEEPEVQRSARVLTPGQPRKHYKIVFIKAPTPPTPTGASIQLPPQDEEKTLIYVLHKRPDDQAEVNIQAAAPTTPSKPEVYFIKYKAQKSAAPATSYGAPPGTVSAPASAPAASYGAPSGSAY